nr:hypothetical protein [Chlamydiota bacterium]
REGIFASLIDARMGGAYGLLQENQGGEVTPLGEEVFLSGEGFSQFSSEVPLVVGPALGRLALRCPCEEVYPEPEAMRKAAFRKWESGSLDRVTCRYRPYYSSESV